MSIDLLKRYGKHDWDCLAGAVGGDCTCGFDAALKAEQPEVVVPVGVVVGLSANPWNVIVRCFSEERPALDTPVYLHPHPEQPERVSVLKQQLEHWAYWTEKSTLPILGKISDQIKNLLAAAQEGK